MATLPKPPDPSHQSLRTLTSAMFDAALEQWPVLKPIWAWLKLEGTGLRQGWVFFTVGAIVVAFVSGWAVHRWDALQRAVTPTSNTAVTELPALSSKTNEQESDFSISIVVVRAISISKTNNTALVITVRIINYGSPAILKDWELRIRLPDGSEATSQPSLLAGLLNAPLVLARAPELDVVSPIGKEPRTGSLLFYKDLPVNELAQPNTVLTIEAKDKNGKAYVGAWRLGDHPGGTEPTGRAVQPD